MNGAAVKTLGWTGSVCSSPQHGQQAIWRWWNYYQQHGEALGITHWGVFNDGPDNLPVEWFVNKWDATKGVGTFEPNRLNLVHWPEKLGRTNVHHVPGFWRNLLGALTVCRDQGFDRFVLLEHDCFVISAELLFEIGRTASGMVCYWCPAYGMPETSIVICGKDRYQRTIEQAQCLLEKVNPTELDRFETAMDWTEIRKQRKGDRYPEVGRAFPADAEYLCQLPIHARMAWGGVIEVLQ